MGHGGGGGGGHAAGAAAAAAARNGQGGVVDGGPGGQAAWLEPYEAGGWALMLYSMGVVGAPMWMVLAGCLAALAVPLVLYVFHKEAKSWHGLGPTVLLLGAGGSALLLVLALSALILHVGSNLGLRAASGEVWKAQHESYKVTDLASELNQSTLELLEELGRLVAECPAQVQVILGGAVKDVEEKAGNLKVAIQVFSDLVSPIPEQLAEVAAVSDGVVGFPLRAGISLSTLVAAAATLAVGTAAADAQYNSGALHRSLGARSDLALPALELLGGVATVSVAGAAASEVALGARMGGYCGDIDTTALAYARDKFGWNSSSFGLVRYYLTGKGANVVMTHVAEAKDAVDKSKAWVSEYQWVIQKSCPLWTPANVTLALHNLELGLNETEALFAPKHVYAHYCTAARELACEGSTRTVAWLVFMQLPLALVCLPLLTYAGSFFLRSFSEGHQFSRLPQEEEASDEEKAAHDKKEDFNPLYYAVYAFAVVTFVIGAFMYFLPSDSIIRRITGTLLYASGIFLLTNSDLIVTFIRLHYQMDRMKKNNQRFELSLKEQSAKVRDLSKAAKGLDVIKKQFGDDVKRAFKEVERLSTTVRSSVRICIKSLLRLYSDKDKDHTVDPGEEFETSMATFRTAFGGVFRKDYDQREKAVVDCVQKIPSFVKCGISEKTLSEMMEVALLQLDVSRIPQELQCVAAGEPILLGGKPAPAGSKSLPRGTVGAEGASRPSPAMGSSPPSVSVPAGTPRPAPTMGGSPPSVTQPPSGRGAGPRPAPGGGTLPSATLPSRRTDGTALPSAGASSTPRRTTP